MEGKLSLPGLLFITYAAAITNHTAKLLAKCMDRSPNKALVTYSDIAYIAYGQKSRVCVSILFSIELLAACVALVVLFADSLNALIPSIDVLTWKILSGLILTPLSFLPLRVLSFSSILGILSTVSIFLIILGNGLLKMEAPGSLYEPQTIYMFPKTWMTLPLSLGLLMSPWGGHGVFPNIYKDMRHPEKYSKAVNITYWFTYPLDTIMMVVGLLMFGDNIHEEVTANILELKGYPEGSKIAMVILIAIIPLTKTPLR
jgi:vesicular inhibitory amino acid transporter